jgi:hypothetical protein
MHISKDTKQSIIGPLVVGIFFGILVAGSVVGFDFEYGPNIYASSKYSLNQIAIFHGIVAFVLVVSCTVFIFGFLPLIFVRISSSIKKTEE